MPGTKAKNFSINKKNKNLLKFLIGAGALLFFIAVLNFFISPIKNTFYALSSPVQKTFWAAGESSAGFLTSFADAGNLNKENQNLKSENQKLLSQVASLLSIEQANQAQTDISATCQNNGFKTVPAGVIGLDDNDILSINKGSADGVSENMPVINQQGAVYGKVFKVYKNFSQVMLISNKNSVINVKVQQGDATKPEIDGVIKGQGNLGVYLDLVPIDDTINQGDVLVTSALEATFPKDLLVGTITKVEKNDQNPHQSAQVQPFISSSADNLFVITNYKQ
ncbi:MAG: rod shape-determining protein MreC [Candidatus Staskawiczbacteria bacterium]|jgi:rod shape-determining protein MreC